MAEHLKAFDRVGLLNNEPPGHRRAALHLVIRPQDESILEALNAKGNRFIHSVPRGISRCPACSACCPRRNCVWSRRCQASRVPELLKHVRTSLPSFARVASTGEVRVAVPTGPGVATWARGGGVGHFFTSCRRRRAAVRSYGVGTVDVDVVWRHLDSPRDPANSSNPTAAVVVGGGQGQNDQ